MVGVYQGKEIIEKVKEEKGWKIHKMDEKEANRTKEEISFGGWW